MDIALTLVVNPDYDTSLKMAEKTAQEALNLKALQHTVLSADQASDMVFSGADLANAKATLQNILSNIAGLDWAIQPTSGRRKKLLLADMDSTMITVECIDELADFVGLKAQVSLITEAAMRGELDFEAALTERVALLRGLSEEKLAACYHDRIKLMPGARALVQTMKKYGAYTALVSGGFTYFTEKVAGTIGFDMNRANVLALENSALTGKVIPPICGAQTKLDTLDQLAAVQNITKLEILAVGDGANDIPMIEAAGLGVAYRAHPKTRHAASAAVIHGDLTALLYFQGYNENEFAE